MAKKSKDILPGREDPNDWGTNYANRSEVSARFMEYCRDRITQTRNNRLDLEQQWLDDLRLWSCVLDETGYVGHSSLFVPELNDQVEGSVERALTALFPATSPVKAIPTKFMDAAKAEKISEAVRYELETKSKLFLQYDKHMRNKTLFGTGVLKMSFERKFNNIWVRDDKGRPVENQVPIYDGVRVWPVDLFRWYMYPETSPSLAESEMQFEDSIMTKEDLERIPGIANLNAVKPIESNTGQDLDHEWVDAERLEIVRLSNALLRYRNAIYVTEVYCNFALNQSVGPVPVRALLGNMGQVLLLQRNGLWFQESPYLASRYIVRPNGVWYGMSLPDKIRSQQYHMNDLANQTMDSLNYTVNPIAIVDPSLAGDINSMKMRPGAKWMGSPEGIEFRSMPDTSGSGLRAMSEIRGMIAQFSDNTPGIAPQLQGKSRSATQATIVAGAVSARQRVRMSSEQLEVLGPLCKRTHILLQQFQTKEAMIRVQGADMGEWITQTVKPSDLVGDCDFIWVGNTLEERNAVRSQQLLAFYSAALQTAALMPGEVDMPALFRLVAKEGFNLSNIDEIFKSLRDKQTVSQEVENIALKQGVDTEIHNGDNDAEHMASIDELLSENEKARGKDKISDEGLLQLMRHREKHVLQKQAKDDLLKAKTRLDALKMAAQAGQAMEQAGGGGEDGREGPAVPSPMEGRPGQVASPQGAFSGAQGAPSGQL